MNILIMYFIMYLSEHHASMIHVVHVVDVKSKYELCPFFTHINKICLLMLKDLKASEITVIQSV